MAALSPVIRRVVVGTDGSDNARHALTWVAGLALPTVLVQGLGAALVQVVVPAAVVHPASTGLPAVAPASATRMSGSALDALRVRGPLFILVLSHTLWDAHITGSNWIFNRLVLSMDGDLLRTSSPASWQGCGFRV